MNYIEWKYKLAQEIGELQFEEQKTIVGYYDELFEDKMAEGFTEEEVLSAFGNPKEVANELTGGLGVMDKTASDKEKEERKAKFKEKFEKFKKSTRKNVNKVLSSVLAGAKKFSDFVVGKINQLDEYHKEREKGDTPDNEL